MKVHSACLALPDLDTNEYNQLEASILRDGQKDTIKIFEDQVLDGRHRLAICEKHQLKPKFEKISVDNPWTYAWQNQTGRRTLNEGQRVALWMLNFSEQCQAWQAKHKASADVARSEKAKGNQNAAKKKTVVAHMSHDCKRVPEHKTRQAIADIVKCSLATVGRAEQLAKLNHDAVIDVAGGKVSLGKAIKKAKKEKRQAETKIEQEKISAVTTDRIKEVCDIRVCSCAELFNSGIKPDAIITDPPYPQEYLDTFSELAKGCASIHAPLVAVMSGQSYLPEVMRRLCEHLTYRWTMAYLTPGGQSAQIWPAKVNTFWKPVLVFGDSAGWIGDVVRSATNDNDKQHHPWGQSESGMIDLIGRLTLPGQTICDPFIGGGSTAIAALSLGRKIIGCDIDKTCVQETLNRVREYLCKK